MSESDDPIEHAYDPTYFAFAIKAGRTTKTPSDVAILKPDSKPVKGVELLARFIVAVSPEPHKAPIDFIYFGRYKNDNNNERPASVVPHRDRNRFGDG